MGQSSISNRRVFIVLNPVSGIYNPKTIRKKIEQSFSKAGWEYSIYETTGNENLARLVESRLSEGYDLVVAAGGDGTVSSVASGLVNYDIPIGFIPTGTWNAIARNLGIPILVDRAIHLILNDHEYRKIDALQIGERYFLLNISVGISSALVQNTGRQQKRRFGFAAYGLNLIKQLFGLKLRHFRIKIDDESIEIKASEIMVVNSSLVGIGELPTKLNIHPDDGKFEVLMVRDQTLMGYLSVAWNALIRREKRTPLFACLRGSKEVTIQSKEGFTVQGDGEVIGKTPVKIRMVPSAVRVCVPIRRSILPILQ